MLTKVKENRFRRARGILFGIVVFATMALPLSAQAPPSGDTFVTNAFPTTNFGSVNSLAVGPGTSSYVQFNLSGIPALSAALSPPSTAMTLLPLRRCTTRLRTLGVLSLRCPRPGLF